MAASAFLYNRDYDDDSENHHHKKRLALSEDFFIFLTNEDNQHEDITMSDQSIQGTSSDEENLKRQHNPRLVVRDEYVSFLPDSETLKSEEKVVANVQQGNSDIQKRQIKPPNKKREFSPRLAVNGEYFLFLPDLEPVVESEGDEIANEQVAGKIQKRQTKPWWPPRKMVPESSTKAKRQTKPIWNFRSYISKKDMTSLDLNKRQRPPIRGPYAYHRIGIGKVHSNRHFVQKRNIDNGYEKRRLPEDIDIMYDNYIKRQKPPYTLGSLLLRESVDENTEQGKISGSPLSLGNFQKRQRPPGFMEHYSYSFAKRQKPPSSE